MSGPLTDGRAGLADDVAGLGVTIEATAVIADRLHLDDFLTAPGIRPNIPQEDLRNLVWDQVRRDLTAQGVLDGYGQPQPMVAAMVDTLGRPDRTLEGRWWRRDVGGVMVRFVVCRKGERHVIAVREGDVLVLQLVAAEVGLAGMLTGVRGPAEPANVESLIGVVAELARCTTAARLASHGIGSALARISPRSSATRVVGWRSPLTNAAQPARARRPTWPPLSSTRRGGGWCRSSGQLDGSFLPGAHENLQSTLDDLLEFLPAGAGFYPAVAQART